MPLQVEGSRIQVLGPVAPANKVATRRARELSDIAPQYVAKSGLCSASELESSRGGSIRIQHVTALSSAAVEGKSRFPKLDECAHFHYEHVDIGPIQVSVVDDDDLKPLSNETEEDKWWSLSVTSQNKTWLVRRSYTNFRMLDQQLHRCIYDRKFSELPELPAECLEEQENLQKLLLDYVKRFSVIAGSQINCGPILNWLELDNRGHRLIVPDTDNCPINTPAVAAAYSVKRYTAQAPDEISFEVGDMISVIDMPPSEESIWWRGKRGFQVGFFPCECVAVIGDKVPRNLQFSPQLSQPTKPVLRKHGKLIAFFRSFILSRPSRRKLKQSGILKERVFGCDLGEHLLNSGHEIPVVLKCCVEFIESHGLVDGIYRLSGVTSNIQKLRNAFDEDRVPALYEDEAILQDVHSVASLLKMYFRELPNPLCTYQLYHQFVGAVQSSQGDDTRLLKMRDVVQKLPPPHYRTLEYLMRHLARVSEKGHETGMTSRNVAIVWAPNLLRCKELEVGGVAALQGVGVQAVVTEFLVCYADLIFCDKLPNFSLPPQQAGSKKSRPKSLAISTPTKLLSLEEARSRALLQAAGKVEQDYIEVGGGPANLPAKYHTVIDLPGGPRKRMGSKRSPIGWKMLFGKSGRGSQSRKDIESKTSVTSDIGLGTSKAVTELDLAQTRRRLRPAKSVESLSSSRNSTNLDLSDPPGGFSSLEDTLSPILLRNNEGKSNGHNRSVSHESYFDHLQDQKEDVALDISEIQVNFDLEESEMRIFSEDETLFSVGSGSLASNSSPRILPIPKTGKSLTGSMNKRLSYPKLAEDEDRFCTSQSADPSPKKQKINDNCSKISGSPPRSKLEEQLSSSVGDIQFIDSVSPDQVLVQAEVHTVRNSSPVSSHLNSTLLTPSSPILPHIPHLTTIKPSVEGGDDNAQPVATGLKKDVAEQPYKNGSFSSVSKELSSLAQITSPTLAEISIFDNDSFSFQSSELTNPDTPLCQSFPETPSADLKDTSDSNDSTPEFNQESAESECEKEVAEDESVFESFNNIAMEFEEKITAIAESMKGEITPPKPEERKPRAVHPYENIPFTKLTEEPRKMLETSFDVIENSGDNSNRNSIVSIKYEAISTESSCDSLINVNKNEESSCLLGGKSINPSPQSDTTFKMSTSKSPTNFFGTDEKVKESEMDLLKECSEWLQGLSADDKPSLNDESVSEESKTFQCFEADLCSQSDTANEIEDDKDREKTSEETVDKDVNRHETKSESKILETNLDALKDFEISPEKKTFSPQKSNSSGNVRQLLSKFEVSPTLKKELVELKCNAKEIKEENVKFSKTKKSIDERPKTLERLSTRRKAEKDAKESPTGSIEKSKSGSHINQRSSEMGKSDISGCCDFDLTDPQRRERIEKYKEKRRNYLREKYRSDSFKVEKDDFVLRLKPRLLVKKDEEVEKGVQLPESPSRTGFGSGSSEKRSPEKTGKRSAKCGEVPSREICRLSYSGDLVGRQRYETPTVSSSIREHSTRRNNFLRFSSERKSTSDFRSTRSSPEKKNLSLDFSLGVKTDEKLSPEFLNSFYSRRRMTDPAKREKSSDVPSDLSQSHKLSGSASGRSFERDDTTPTFCIRDMAALFEKRDDSKTHKQYLSSV